MPGESRTITARFATADAGSETACLEVGGWNIETDFDCQTLDAAPTCPKAGEAFQVRATVAHTFLDGSRVTVRCDGEPVASAFAWARGGQTQTITLPVTAPDSGRHVLTLGSKRLELTVQPERE